MSHVRVRFAPSPTGHLHIGGARTALFNWLYARNTGGKFILRIEDTDRTRSTDEYIESIMEGMRWLDLTWDEGPFRQTERFDIYRAAAEKLVAEGKAYYCYCPAEELEQRRQEAQNAGQNPRYDRRCRDRKEPVPGVSPTIRFKTPIEGEVTVNDMIKGSVSFDNSQLDDLIIVRSDGTPTYNFVVVVDDVEMGITHVIRGDDHLNNTPKQLHIYRAMGYEVPAFGHLSMILGADKTRLSKRHGATSVIAYRDDGYLSDALVNYLVRLGWAHGDQEVFTREELVRHFSFESVSSSAAVFNPEKLLWLNQEYIKKTPHAKLAELVVPFLIKQGTITEQSSLDIDWLARAAGTLTERAKTLVELAATLRYYIVEEVEFKPEARAKFLVEKNRPVLADIRARLAAIPEAGFTHEAIDAAFKATMEALGAKMGAVAQPVRVAMTGGAESPGIHDVLLVLGQEKTLKRLDRAIASIA